MSGWAYFLLLLLLLLVFGAIGWIVFTQLRARRLGLPAPPLLPFFNNSSRSNNSYSAPAPAPGGIQGWISSKYNALRSNRTSAGAYESTGYSGAGVGGAAGRDRRGFGALDPDEAWDARVGNEADYGDGGYYEEQELALQDPVTGPYGGSGYGGGHVGVGGIEGRGRSRERQRELDSRYDEEVHGGQAKDPFADENRLRGVSPRPVVETGSVRTHKSTKSQRSLGQHDDDMSPTERRSMFHEEM